MESAIFNIPILVYHKVGSRKEMGINVVSSRAFESHLRCLKELGYQTVTFLDLLNSRSLPEKPVILTFDDGYQCIYQHAFPLLRKYGFRAVVGMVAGFIGKLNSWDANLGGIRFRHLSAGELRELLQAGWEIASHGWTHRALPYLNSAQVFAEIYRSRQFLETALSAKVISFVYPFGYFNRRCEKMISEAGYRFACLDYYGHSNLSNPYRLRRLPVFQFDTHLHVQRKLQQPAAPRMEAFKMRVFSWPRRFTPIYQKLFKPELFLDK